MVAGRRRREKKKNLDEELQKQEVERLNLTQSQIEQSASDTARGQTQDMDNPEIQDPEVPISSTSGQSVVPTLKLVPFVQKKGEEIPDFNTVF